LAIKSLESAIEADPAYVPAYTVLAKIYGLAGYYYVLPPPEAWAKAERFARRALAIDTGDGEAHAAAGFVLGLNDRKWGESERAFRRALELAPASADVHGSYAMAALMPQGRLEEAVAEFRRSLELEPLVPFANMGAGFALLALKRYDEALAHYKRGLELISTFPDMWWDTGMCYALMGRNDDALKHFREADVRGGDDLAKWQPNAAQNALVGNTARAAEQVRALEAQASKMAHDDYMDMARIYGLLGDVPNTMRWLERSWEVRHPEVVWLKVDPRFEKVRNAPEFQAMLRRLGL
jgi:tetratricopeptide (TPR) repeat protein